MKTAYSLKNIQLALLILITISILVLVLSGVTGFSHNFETGELNHIESLIERLSIQCYASEGAYPPDLDYLVKHYGLIIYENKYLYEYEPVAENIKPQIQVFIRLDYD